MDGDPFQEKRPGELVGPVSSVQYALGEIMQIDILEAHCVVDEQHTTEGPEIIDYDQALRFVGSRGGLLLSTIYENITGAIEISTEELPSPEEFIESYRVRFSLGPASS